MLSLLAPGEAARPASAPYRLTSAEGAGIRRGVVGTLASGNGRFGPISARRRATGEIEFCGLVSPQSADGSRRRFSVFNGLAVPDAASGALRIADLRISGANANTLAVLTVCRDAGFG